MLKRNASFPLSDDDKHEINDDIIMNDKENVDNNNKNSKHNNNNSSNHNNNISNANYKYKFNNE